MGDLDAAQVERAIRDAGTRCGVLVSALQEGRWWVRPSMTVPAGRLRFTGETQFDVVLPGRSAGQ